jgi:aarF domain-containing kinase
MAVGAATLTALYVIDTEFNARTIQRTLRTLYNGVWITYEYKINFEPGADVDAIHRRVATRILDTCKRNAGLYVKFGQGVASMNHVLRM